MKAILFILLQTILIGTVTDSQTGEPIPCANLSYVGTQVGTSTDNDGSFCLRSSFDHKRTLVVSAVGYWSERFVVEPNKTGVIEVALKEKVALLQEFVVTPGTNPAFAILDSLRAHRPYSSTPLPPYSSTTKLSLSHFTSKQLQRRFWHALEPMMVDSMLPLYLVSREGADIVSEQAFILTQTDYQTLIPPADPIDVYDNNFPITDKSFLSPLSSSAKAYYNYYWIEDSCRLDFKTKNPFYPTLDGSLWIDTVSWTLTRFSASIPRQSAVNYLTGGCIEQRYEQGALISEYTSQILNLAIKQDSSHIWPSVLVENTSPLHSPLSPLPSPLSTIHHPQSTIHSPLSTLNSPPDSLPGFIRFASWVGQIISSGYIPTGTAIDFGKIPELFALNPTEGLHLGIPLRTNERLWKNVCLEAAVGYGFYNRRFTGLGRVSWNLPSLRRNILSFEYRDGYVYEEVDDFSRLMRENTIGYGNLDFTNSLLRCLYANSSAVNSLIRLRQFQVLAQTDWSEHVETNLFFKAGVSGDESAVQVQDPYSFASIGGVVRVGWGERKVDSYFRRVHVYGHLPVLYFGVETGAWSPLSPYSSTPLPPYSHVYAKFTFMIRQNVNLGMGGTLSYLAQVGTTVGQVPFAMLHHFEGNQSYGWEPYRFTLMNNLQMNARHYAALHLNWNGRGVLFNLIPGIRYLRLRELVCFKMAADLDPLHYPQSTIHSQPYVEIGCGIGNIFRVLDLYSVWRLTNREDSSTPLWAMRFRFNIEL